MEEECPSIDLEEWNRRLQPTLQPKMRNLEDFLEEPDDKRRQENIRDIYQYLNSQELVRISHQLSKRKKPRSNFLLGFLSGVLVSGIVFYFTPKDFFQISNPPWKF
jgi:hypothetical protein